MLLCCLTLDQRKSKSRTYFSTYIFCFLIQHFFHPKFSKFDEIKKTNIKDLRHGSPHI